jgi:hypothetical protein
MEYWLLVEDLVAFGVVTSVLVASLTSMVFGVWTWASLVATFDVDDGLVMP